MKKNWLKSTYVYDKKNYQRMKRKIDKRSKCPALLLFILFISTFF